MACIEAITEELERSSQETVEAPSAIKRHWQDASRLLCQMMLYRASTIGKIQLSPRRSSNPERPEHPLRRIL